MRTFFCKENETNKISAVDALERLRVGNHRFVTEIRGPGRGAATGTLRRSQLVQGQAPFAIILGCSDSRVPAEIVFDHGLGHLFVIRVAGNIVAPSQIGSVEFAAERYGARLVVVLGHSSCGAVQATLEELEQPTENRSPNLRAIVDRIRPGVEPLLLENPHCDPKTLLHKAVRMNIHTSVNDLRHGSEMVEALIQNDGLLVVGAEYSLKTGVVDFFDGLQ